MNLTDLEQLEKITNEATQGKWGWEEYDYGHELRSKTIPTEVIIQVYESHGGGYISNKHNKDFVAALNPSTALRLIALAKWALEARDALAGIDKWFKELTEDQNENLGHGLESAIENWDSTMKDPFEMLPILNCLSKFPKEEE